MIIAEIFIIELLSEFSYDISILPKKKKKKKKGEKILQKNISNFNQFPLPPMAQFIHNHSETFQIVTESISRHVCVSFSNRSKRTFQFSRNENLHLSSHTHTHTCITKGCTQKVTRCRGQLSFHLPSFYFAPWLRFIVANPFLFVSQTLNHADFYRVSSLVCLDAGSFEESILTTFVHLYRCCAKDEEYLRGVNRIHVCGIIFFSFVCWRDCCYFFHRVIRIIDHLESCWKYSKRR